AKLHLQTGLLRVFRAAPCLDVVAVLDEATGMYQSPARARSCAWPAESPRSRSTTQPAAGAGFGTEFCRTRWTRVARTGRAGVTRSFFSDLASLALHQRPPHAVVAGWPAPSLTPSR